MLSAMRVPAIVLNLKTYPDILGKRGWELAKRFAAVADDTGASIVLAPPTSDLAHIAKLVHLPIFSQHVDAVEPGPTTGWIPPEALLEAGAAGTLINHSERKVAWEDVAKALDLGTSGVLLSSGIVKAKDPEKALRDLVKGLR